jgi:hypothetical protein
VSGADVGRRRVDGATWLDDNVGVDVGEGAGDPRAAVAPPLLARDVAGGELALASALAP